jgi:Polysaccharide deacetylase
MERTCGRPYGMSALPPKADVCGALAHVCFGPIADIAPAYSITSSARDVTKLPLPAAVICETCAKAYKRQAPWDAHDACMVARSVWIINGQLIISIDLELAWGVWDRVTPDDLRFAAEHERPICTSLIELLDRYQIPATWAIVAALLDKASAAEQPGDKRCWYAPDVIEQIVNAKSRHEVGSHGGRHRYFDRMTAAQAREDLGFAREQHRAHALALG